MLTLAISTGSYLPSAQDMEQANAWNKQIQVTNLLEFLFSDWASPRIMG